MSRLLYTPPSQLERVLGPTEDQLRYAILEQPWEEWWNSPNNEAALEVVCADGDNAHGGTTDIEKTGKRIEFAAGRPFLTIKQPSADDFFLRLYAAENEFVPYNGESFADYQIDHWGGEELRIPTACLVDAPTALTIVHRFVSSIQRSDVVEWYKVEELPRDEDIYGDF